jgi:hypothetical protein
VQDLGPATEDQVILAWLQAETKSPRFKNNVRADAATLAAIQDAALNPDLTNRQQNDLQRQVIAGTRGFGRGVNAFQGIANDVVWRRAHVSIAEVGAMLYINDGGWKTLAPTTLEVREGAGNVGHDPTADPNKHILAVAQEIRDTNPVPSYPELICLKRPDGRISVIEGNTRATAYVIEADRLPDGVDIYLGDSASIATWAYL